MSMGEALHSLGTTQKYDIPLSHLDYTYVKSCTNIKELEKILKVLRSGEEGCYPDLERLAEDKLKELAPNSRVLRKEDPVSRLSDLDATSRSSLQADIQNWNLEMKSREEELLTSGSGALPDDPDLPPVRSGAIGPSASQKDEDTQKSNKRVKPREYREWDKVDVDEELKKVDLAEEDKERERMKLKDQRNGMPDIECEVSTKGLTEEEKLMKANREKDKGNEAFRSGDYEESVLYYSRSISLLPTTASYNNRALAYLKKNDWDKCLSDLKQVLQSEPDNIKGLLRRGTAYKGKKDFQNAAKDFQRVLELEPTNKRAQELLTEVESEKKKEVKEKEEKKKKGRRMKIEEVEGSDSECETPSQMNGYVTQNKGQDSNNTDSVNSTSEEQVREMGECGMDKPVSENSEQEVSEKEVKGASDCDNVKMDESSSICDSDASASTSNGVSCAIGKEDNSGMCKSDNPKSEKDEKDKDEQGTEQIADKQESQSAVHTRPVFYVNPLPADVSELRQDGNNLFRTGQYADALVKYEDAINKLDQQEEGNEVSLSLLYSNQAACKLKTGDCSSAIADCTMALDLVPHSIKPLLRRASAFETKEKYRKAYADYKHVLSIDSTVELAHQGASRCQKHLKDLDGSKWRDKLPTLVNVFPWEIPDIIDPSVPRPEAQTVPAKHEPVQKKVVPDTNKMKEAKIPEPKLGAPVETPHQKFDQCKAKGNDHVKRSEFREAVDCYTQCIDSLPNMTVAYTNRALCYIRLNKPTDALSDCNEALKREPENCKALYRRAQAKKMLEHYKDSLVDLLQLLKIEPTNSAAKKEVEVVKQYYKKEFEKTKLEAKQQMKEAPQKQRRKMKIEEVEDEEDDTKTSKPSPDVVPKQSPKQPISSTSAADSPKSQTQSTTSSKKSKKSKSKGKATSGTSQPVVPPPVPKLEKATPYEFLQAWNSLKSASGVDPFTELLLQVQPEELPKLVSNKLDGQMLHKMIACAKQIVGRGDIDISYNILKNLCRVERFDMVKMFMTAEDKKDISQLCDTLTQHKSTVYTEEEVNKLRKGYGS